MTTKKHTIRNVVIIACAIDAADKALLPATFKALSEELQVGPSQLGALNFAQSIAFSLALPVWGSLMRYFSARDLMTSGCISWAALTFLIAGSTSYAQQLVLRILVGAALAVVNPIGQAIICDVVPEAEHGFAFGLLQTASVTCGGLATVCTTSMASFTILGVHGWRIAYLVVACLSLLAGLLVHVSVPATTSRAEPLEARGSWLSEQQRVLHAVAGRPSFIIMVAQGVTGGIPWNAFAFLTFYFQLSGYSDFEASQIVLLGGSGGVFGGLIGGLLGDYFGRIWPFSGRCAVAQASVILGTVFFLGFMHIPASDSRSSAWSFYSVVLSFFMFNLTSGWTPSAALRPICGAIFYNSQDRAQVLALWIALEGVVASCFGAPLVGVLSEAFGYRMPTAPDSSALPSAEEREESLEALRSALLGVCLLPWALCAIAWIPMYWTYPRDHALCKAAREADLKRMSDDIFPEMDMEMELELSATTFGAADTTGLL